MADSPRKSRAGGNGKSGSKQGKQSEPEKKRITTLSDEQMLEAVEAFNAAGGNQSEAARALGLQRQTYRQRLEHAINHFDIDTSKKVKGGQVSARVAESLPLPSKGRVKRYILTSTQNNTHAHERLWDNLKALAAHYGNTEIFVGTFTYNHNAYGPLAVKRGTRKKQSTLWYEPIFEPHFMDEPLELAPGLVWAGKFNALPTATWPLSDLQSYNGRKSNIFPHATFAMDSVESAKHEPTKFNYTTGTVTQRNYIQKKAGIKAEQRHGYGAVIVEVDSQGRWYVRQLEAGEDGTIHDLDLRAKDGKVEKGEWCEAVVWGDIHEIQLNRMVKKLAWGKGGMLDVLRPRRQVFHDLLDFRSRNHHDFKDPYLMFRKWMDGVASVTKELTSAADFLAYSHRDWCQSVVAYSNHDAALTRWTRESDHRQDPENAIILLKLQLAFYEAMWGGRDSEFHMLKHALSNSGLPDDLGIHFLMEDESHIICRDHFDGIELGEHGHNGPGGKVGTPTGFAKSGRRMIIGDKHRAGWYHGVCVAGISGNLDQGYNRGPSAWSHSHVIAYENSARSIVTMWENRWRA